MPFSSIYLAATLRQGREVKRKFSFSDMNFFDILLFRERQEVGKKLKYKLVDNLIPNHSSPILFQASQFAYLLQ